MYTMKLEGSDDHQVVDNTVAETVEVTPQVDDQVLDTQPEEVVENNNVLTFNSDDDVLEYLKTKEELMSKVTPKSESKD